MPYIIFLATISSVGRKTQVVFNVCGWVYLYIFAWYYLRALPVLSVLSVLQALTLINVAKLKCAKFQDQFWKEKKIGVEIEIAIARLLHRAHNSFQCFNNLLKEELHCDVIYFRKILENATPILRRLQNASKNCINLDHLDVRRHILVFLWQ